MQRKSGTQSGRISIDSFSRCRSEIHGYGVRTEIRIPGRRKLGEVGGELVRLPQARKKAEKRALIFLVELDDNLALDCTHGSVFRYLNHSCKPNCYLRVYRNRVEVYSLGVINKGTELTIDYGETPHKNGMECRCGSKGCRGII